MSKWRTLERDFRDIPDDLGQLRADWSDQPGLRNYWMLAGGASRGVQDRFIAVAELAAQRLAASSPAPSKVPAEALAEAVPLTRWLTAVRHATGQFRAGPHGTIQDDAGKTQGHIFMGSIPKVIEASALLCLQLAVEDSGTLEPDRPMLPSSEIFVSEKRLDELRALKADAFDLRKLVRLCEELNIAYRADAFLATAMLTRALLDHVPPIFRVSGFAQVASNYGGGSRSFKGAMERLDKAARAIADAHLHSPIRSKETLPVSQQVNFAAEMDVLLAEIVRIL